MGAATLSAIRKARATRRWLVVALLVLLGTGMLLAGLGLGLDHFSLRQVALSLPTPALARLIYRAHAALEHRRAQIFEGTFAALGCGVILTAVCLVLRLRVALRAVSAVIVLSVLTFAAALGILVGSDREGVVAYKRLSRVHVPDAIVSPRMPPPGGAHAPRWQNCGVYAAPISSAAAVHSLEHGAVWLTYRPDLEPEAVWILRDLVRHGDHLLLSPYPDQLFPVIATVWGYQLLLDRADDPRLARFIERYKADPSGPEPGAPCSDGVGQPDG